MEKTMLLVLAAAVSMAVIALAPPQAEAAISCNTVANDLTPCINFVLYGGVTPPTNCCDGVKALYKAATATADRQAVCSCLKSVASQATPTIISNAAALPGKCGVSIPYKISPSTDCSSVH